MGGRRARAPGQGGGCHPRGLGPCQCPLSYPPSVAGAPSGVMQVLRGGVPCVLSPWQPVCPPLPLAQGHPSPLPCLAAAGATCCPHGAQDEERGAGAGSRPAGLGGSREGKPPLEWQRWDGVSGWGDAMGPAGRCEAPLPAPSSINSPSPGPGPGGWGQGQGQGGNRSGPAAASSASWPSPCFLRFPRARGGCPGPPVPPVLVSHTHQVSLSPCAGSPGPPRSPCPDPQCPQVPSATPYPGSLCPPALGPHVPPLQPPCSSRQPSPCPSLVFGDWGRVAEPPGPAAGPGRSPGGLTEPTSPSPPASSAPTP